MTIINNAGNSPDAVTCALDSVQTIHASLYSIKDQIAGPSPLDSLSSDSYDLEGKSTEVTLHVDQWADVWRKIHSGSSPLISEETNFGGFSFHLEVSCCDDDRPLRKDKKVSAYLSINAFEGGPIEKMVVNYSISAFAGEENIQTFSSSQDFAKDIEKGCCWGWDSFLTAAEANKYEGRITFIASCFIAELVYASNDTLERKRNKPIQSNERSILVTTFYTRLVRLNDEFITDMQALYSDHFFFSEQFSKSLVYNADLTPQKESNPNLSTPSRIPAMILIQFRQKAEASLKKYRENIIQICKDEVEDNLSSRYDQKAQLPQQLLTLLMRKCEEKVKSQMSVLANLHTFFIEMELTSSHSSSSNNSKFVKGIQSIQKIILENNNKATPKPSHLRHLDSKKIKNMSVEEKNILNRQIEIFVSYKLMLSRFIDNVIMSTQSELMYKQICAMFKKSMVEAVLFQSDEDEDEDLSLISSHDLSEEESTCHYEQFEYQRDILDDFCNEDEDDDDSFII
mmetsp:Transcript_11304/g.15091  ORF Transcript_11304/g.15091 Transcript_11304/m.15091 type:complete len:512 (+) Transcript_11304:44-1579(+)